MNRKRLIFCRGAANTSFFYNFFDQNKIYQQQKVMICGFWQNAMLPSGWHYFIPFPQQTQVNCQLIFPTQTHIQENIVLTQASQKREKRQKKLIDLSREDLIEAGYESTKKLWSQEQDKLLLKLVEQEKIPWKQIQKHIPERTQKMCYSRYRRLISQTKQSWSKEQDQKIKNLVETFGEDWKRISQQLQNRNTKQIKQRYLNYLRPQISRDIWEVEEDLKIIECLNKFGKKWKIIEQHMGNRTDNQIKNRYYGRLKILYKNKLMKERRKKKRAQGLQKSQYQTSQFHMRRQKNFQ